MIAIRVLRLDGTSKTVKLLPDPAQGQMQLLARIRQLVRRVQAESKTPTPPPDDHGPTGAA